MKLRAYVSAFVRLSPAFLLVIAFTLAVSSRAYGTDLHSVLTQYTIASWSEKDGLPDAYIYAIAQDATGYLWIGTQVGPYRFDGARFTPWTTLVGDTHAAREVRALRASSDGSMWIGFGGDGGIGVYKDGLERFFDASDGLPIAAVSVLLEYPAGQWWAGTAVGLFQLDGQHWKHISDSQGVPDGPVNTGTINDQGQLLVGSNRSVLELDQATERFREVSSFTDGPRALVEASRGHIAVSDQITGYRWINQSPSPNEVTERGRGRALLRDSRGNLWVGTAGQGLWRVRFDSNDQVVTVEHATALTGLLADGVLALAEDREGNIWAGTTEGLNRLTPYKVAQVTNVGLVAGVEQADAGALWIGTVDELFLMSGPNAAPLPIPHALRGGRLRAIHTDEKGQLWVATDRGLFYWNNGVLLPVKAQRGSMPLHIDTITSAPNGGVWVFDNERGLLLWRNGQFITTTLPPGSGTARVEATLTDSTGRAWFALSNGIIISTDGDKLRAYDETDGLTAGIYQAIYEDRAHNLWFGGTAGMSRYDGTRFVTVHSDEGFPVSHLTAIVEDTHGDLWVGSGSGILHLPIGIFDQLINTQLTHARYLILNRADGLAGLPLAYSQNRRAIRAADGHLWFVTGRGLTVIDPDAFNTVPPATEIRIESIVADGARYDTHQRVTLPAGTNRIEFEYTTINLTSPLRQQFRYKLEGFDRDWVDGGARRQAAYTNLPPYTYHFRVATTDPRGEWIEADSTWAFSIAPHFYKTKWFAAIVVGLCGLVVGGAWRLHIRSVRHDFTLLLGERARLSRELHDTLLQGLVGVALQFDAMANDPKFGFSSAQRQQFVHLRKRVEEYMREARQSIADLRLPRVGTHDLSVALREAAERAISDHPITFTFTQQGTPRPISARIKEDLLKIGREAIGNAVRHAHANQIMAELEFSDDALLLRVIDNGHGFDRHIQSQDGHYGLTSMRERAEELGGRLTIRSNESGTHIEAIVPLRPEHKRSDDASSAHSGFLRRRSPHCS
jgi:signal transduction histidine kinase/ligand-binding sensor domain-containing protein